MGRRSLLTPEAIEKYQQALAGAAWPEVAAQHAGWSVRSYYRYLAGASPASVALRAATEQAENQLELRCGAVVALAAKTSPRWAMEILRRRFPQRWALPAPPPVTADTPTEGRPTADEVVVLDPAFVELVVPRLLAAGERGSADSADNEIAAFEDRRPRRVRPPEEGSQ